MLELCRMCGKQRSVAELHRIGHSVIICHDCLANPVGTMPRVNQSGGHFCSNCLCPFPVLSVGTDNMIEERVDEIVENGIRYEVCKRCADLWEAGNLHLIRGTQHYQEKYG